VSSRYPTHPPDETILYLCRLSAVYSVCVWGWEPPAGLIESSISVRAAGGGAPFWVPPAGSPVRLIHLAPVIHPPLIEARRSGAERISGGLGPTHAREHSCVWRFFSETTTIPLTPPVLCVTVWDRSRETRYGVASVSGILYQSLNELTVRRAHPVCLQLDRSPDPGRQGRALTKRAVLVHLRNVPIHVSDLF
jgi:hypothetical protein